MYSVRRLSDVKERIRAALVCQPRDTDLIPLVVECGLLVFFLEAPCSSDDKEDEFVVWRGNGNVELVGTILSTKPKLCM